MYVRIAGVVLLFGLSLFFCLCVSRMERGRVRQTEGFLLLLRYVRTQISCFRTPVQEIYGSFRNPALSECGFLDALRQYGFPEALDRCTGRLYLDEEELKTLSALGRELGRSYCEDQIALCDYTLEQMERAFDRRREEAPKRTRVAHSLVLTGGLMLILVLL